MVGILGNFVGAAIDFGWVCDKWYLDHNTKQKSRVTYRASPCGVAIIFLMLDTMMCYYLLGKGGYVFGSVGLSVCGQHLLKKLWTDWDEI